MRLGFALSPGARRVATSSAPLVLATDPMIMVQGVPGASVTVSISTGGAMATTITGTLDASGTASILPPYAVPDGARQVTATQTIGGVQSPPSAPAVLSMPNAAKSAVSGILGRMSVAPPAGRAEAMYAFISTTMAANVWSRLDLLSILAAHDLQAALLNWIGPVYDLGRVNSPQFTVNRGFTGGGTAYLEAAGYNPSAGGTLHALNDAAMGVWVLTPSPVAGVDVYTGSGRLGRRNTTGDDYAYRINDGGGAYGPGGSSPGLFSGGRSDSATQWRYRNGALTGTSATPSVANAAYLRILGVNSAWSGAEIAAVFAGASLTEAQHAALHAALRTYLLTIGAIVP